MRWVIKPTDRTSGVEEFWDPLRSGLTMLLLWSWNCPSIPGKQPLPPVGLQVLPISLFHVFPPVRIPGIKKGHITFVLFLVLQRRGRS